MKTDFSLRSLAGSLPNDLSPAVTNADLIKEHQTLNKFIMLSPGSGPLYDALLQAGINLYNQFPYKIQSAVIACNMFTSIVNGKLAAPVRAGVLLDTGGHVQLAAPAFLQQYDIKPIRKGIEYCVRTAHGVKTGMHNEYKLRFELCGQGAFNTTVLNAEGPLGHDIPMCGGLREIAGELFGLPPGAKLPKVNYQRGWDNKGKPVTMDVILGVPSTGKLLVPVKLSRYGLSALPYCPDLYLMKSSLSESFVLFGLIGINPDTVDSFGPSLRVPAGFQWTGNPVELSREAVDRLNTQFNQNQACLAQLASPAAVSQQPALQGGSVHINLSEAHTVDNYLRQESEIRLDTLKCQVHSKIPLCADCQYLNKNISLLELEVYQKVRSSIKLTKIGSTKRGNDKFQITLDFIFDKKILELSDPKYCNLSSARRNTVQLISRLIKKNQLENVKQIFKEKEDLGVYVRLSAEEVKNLEKTNHLFTKTNFTENTKPGNPTTKVRVTNNTSTTIPKAGFSLSNFSYKGPNLCNSVATGFYRFSLFAYPLVQDVSRAFHRLKCDNFTALLRCKYWFDDPEQLQGAIIYKITAPDFGDEGSSIALEASERAMVAPACVTHAGRRAVADFRVVDDILDSFPDRLQWCIVAEDIRESQERYNLDLKHSLSTHSQTPYDGEEERFVTVLGVMWDRLLDTVKPVNFLSLHEKVRGRSTGILLEDEQNLDNLKITRLHLIRTCQQQFDPSGKCTQIVNICSKILVSKAAEFTNSYTACLADFDKDFHKECLQHLLELQKFSGILPFPRAYIPVNYQLKCFKIAHDGSIAGYSGVIHAISEKQLNNSKIFPDPPGRQFVSRIVGARSKVSKKSSQSNELSAYLLSVLMCLQLVKDTPELQGESGWPIVIYFPGDSVSSSHYFSKKVKITETYFRNCFYKILDTIDQILGLAPNLILKFQFVKSTDLVADLNSKYKKNFIELTNSQFWRAGPPCYVQQEQWDQDVYLTAAVGRYEYQQLSDALTGIANNPLANLKSGSELQAELVRTNHTAKSSFSIIKLGLPSQAVEDLFIFPLIPQENLLNANLLPQSSFLISKSLYDCLANRRNQLIKFLAVTHHVIGFCFRLKFKQWPSGGISETWRLLTQSAQLKNPPPRHKYLSVEEKPNKIIMCELRLSNSSAAHLFNAKTPHLPVLSEPALNMMLVRRCHLKISEVWGEGPLHLTAKGNIAETRTGPFGAIIPQANKYVAMIKNECLKCNVEFKKFFNPNAGDRYTRLPPQLVVRVFQKISLDPTGPYRIKPKLKSRDSKHSDKIWICRFSCLTFGATEYLLLSGMSAAEIRICVQRLQLQYNVKITHCTADAGTNVTAKILNEVLPEAQIRNIEVGHQKNNYVENSIKLWKLLSRQILNITTNVKFPVLCLDMLFLLFDRVKAAVNQIPYQLPSSANDSGILLCPADFMMRQNLNNIVSSEQQTGLLGLSTIYKKFDNMISDEFHEFAQTELKSYSKEAARPESRVHKLSEDSVVQIIDFNKRTPVRFGRVVKLLSERRAVVKTSSGLKTLAVEGLLPTAIFGPN